MGLPTELEVMANLNARKDKKEDKKSKGSRQSNSKSSNGSKKNINVEDGLSKGNDELGALLIDRSKNDNIDLLDSNVMEKFKLEKVVSPKMSKIPEPLDTAKYNPLTASSERDTQSPLPNTIMDKTKGGPLVA